MMIGRLSMYIYADVLFIINIMMNSMVLMLTAWTVGVAYKFWRILLAAVVGGCYVLLGMLPNMELCHTVLAKFVISWLLIYIAFGYTSKRKSFLLLASFYVISFILGGSIVGWVYFWQENYYSHALNKIFTNLSWKSILWGSCLGAILIVSIIRRMVSSTTRNQSLYRVKIEYNGQVAELTAMLDTGNSLYTTIGHKPVVLVSQYSVEPILSEDVVTFLRENVPEMWLVNLSRCIDDKWLSRTQIIPYHGIGSRSMLLAFRADALLVSLTGTAEIRIQDVVIGIYSGALSEDGTYAGLLHPQIINELYKKEGASICA
ncbi:sigma-E processing peptidase SpoIIGA [Pelosinus propionicus]|nr:sigma-E processing peptidase SpoIIGA [Pelosinus propionicus]